MSRRSPSRRHNTSDGDTFAQCGGIGESGDGSQVRRKSTRRAGFALSQLRSTTDFAAARDFGVDHYIGVKTLDRWHARDLDAPPLDCFE